MRNRRPLLLLESANLVAVTSNALLMLTIPWLILERTDSPLAAGVAGALTGIPGILLAPIAGALVDRWGRKTVSVGSDVLSAISVALFPLADSLGLLDLWLIFVLTFIGATFDPAGYTARKALIPDTARASTTDLNTTNGIHEGIFMAGWVLGPVLGAVAIATVGAVSAMWISCVAFLLAALAISMLKVPNRISIEASRETLWAESLAAPRMLMRDKAVWAITLAVAVMLLVYMPTETVLLPVYFEGMDQPGGFGIIIAAMAGGAMIGAFGYSRIARHVTRRKLALLCITGACVAYVPMAFLPALWLFLLAGFLLGLAWGPLEPLLNTLIQERFPVQHHGRIYGVQLALFYAAPPLGELAAGTFVTFFGVQPVFVGIAVLLLVTAVSVTLIPVLEDLDQDSAQLQK
ncbi:MAG: MFS transporter [Micrococcales bacterium]|nr:MFS transporter [Micrococcales bacterium]